MKFSAQLVFCFAVFSAASHAQDLYVYSDIEVNESTGDGMGTFSSSTDYSTDYYYDLFAEGWLYFQPDGGSENEVCTNWASVGNQTYVQASCTANVGSAVGYFSLSTVHDLWTVYYVYQIDGGCYDDCYDYEDEYGYSLISNPNYSDNTYIYAPGYSVAIAQQTAITAQLFQVKRKGACVYPSSETTNGMGFTNGYWPYLGLYMQDLNGGTFTGRYVTEYNTTASDGCWRSPNSGSPVTSLSDRGLWYVGSILGIDSSGTTASYLYSRANAYGYDNLGFYLSSGSQRLYEYVNDMRPSGNACSVTATQTMYMYCTGYTGAGQYYTTGSTIGDIIAASSSAASLTTTRSSVTNVRNYP